MQDELTKEIAVLGEYTTEQGPAPDYFLVVVHWDGSWREYDMSAPEAKSVLDSLGVSETSLVLFNRTDPGSRVVHPLELRDQPLFVFHDALTGVRKLLDAVRQFGLVRVSLELTPAVRKYLADHEPAINRRP